jgi:signal peptidase II
MAEATEEQHRSSLGSDPKGDSGSSAVGTSSRSGGNDQKSNHRILGFSIAALIFVVDQLAKYVVTYTLELRERGVMTLADILNLRWTENPGVSMGFLTAGTDVERWLLVALTAAISIGVVFWLWREKRRDDTIALALVLGGALGNIVDRVRYGFVVDFIDLHFGAWRPFLIFNVADAAITIGVLLLLFRALLTRERKTPKDIEPKEVS